jgi:hypothetical protein
MRWSKRVGASIGLRILQPIMLYLEHARLGTLRAPVTVFFRM